MAMPKAWPVVWLFMSFYFYIGNYTREGSSSSLYASSSG